MIRLLCWAIFIVFLMATTAVLAVEIPDKALTNHIGSFPVVYSGSCKVDSMRMPDVPCQIFYDKANEMIWLCLYDKHGLTHIIAVNKGKETFVWVRPSLTS